MQGLQYAILEINSFIDGIRVGYERNDIPVSIHSQQN
jgi:hypothetical protein